MNNQTSNSTGEPQIIIKKGLLELTGPFDVDIGVEVENGTWETAVTINSEATFKGDISISNKLILKANIKTITAGIFAYENSKIGDINIDMLKQLIGIVEQIIRLSLNTYIGRGINLAQRLNITIDLGEVDFSIEDRYLTLQSDPNSKSLLKLYDRLEHDFSSNLEQGWFYPLLENAMKDISAKDLFGRHENSGFRNAYKGYKVFENVLNYGNDDYEAEDLSDL